MLETLIASRVRRTLLEYLLTHPESRFYLRGLAKELGLSVSPLRRELKRFERQGLLKAYQEANVLFYVVHQDAPLFAQLKRTIQPTVAPASQAEPQPVPGSEGPHERSGAKPQEPLVASTVISSPQIERLQRTLRPVLPWPALIGVISLCLLIVVVLGTVSYLAMTNQRLLSLTTKAVTTPRSQVTVVESQPSASGTMRSPRWRLVPGAMGGFSPGTGEESY